MYQNQTKPSVGFVEAGKMYFNKFADFESRSRRSEYFKGNIASALFIGLIEIVLLFLFALMGEVGAALYVVAVGIISLVMIVPGLSMSVRRLHDVGKSGWWLLLNMVPLGGIILFVWACTDSKEDNKWGPNPKVVSAWQPVTPDPPEVFAPVPPVTPVRPIEPVKAVVAPVVEVTVPQAEAKGVTLYLYSGPMAGTCFEIPAGSAKVLGRNPAKSDLLLKQYETVSGAHCRIACCGDYITVTDLNSTNGTYVNGVRLTPNQAVSAQNGANVYLANSACAFQVRF